MNTVGPYHNRYIEQIKTKVIYDNPIPNYSYKSLATLTLVLYTSATKHFIAKTSNNITRNWLFEINWGKCLQIYSSSGKRHMATSPCHSVEG